MLDFVGGFSHLGPEKVVCQRGVLITKYIDNMRTAFRFSNKSTLPGISNDAAGWVRTSDLSMISVSL